MLPYKDIYDISVFLGTEAVDTPGSPQYSRDEIVYRVGDREICNIAKLMMSSHSGTHIDTPAHFIPDGKNLDEYPLEQWILPAQVVNIEDREAVRPIELNNLDIAPGEALLFRTYNSTSGKVVSGVYSEDFIYVSPEAADFCVERRVSLVGIDYGTIEKHGDLDYPTHHKLLGNEILILEGINLKEVPPGKYTLFCPPLRIKGAEGAPARAMLAR